MNSKVWLTVFSIFAVLVIGGAGFYCFSASGKYSEALEGWDSKVASIRRLEQTVPYPEKGNAEELEKKVEVYKTSVDKLFESLNKFQKPLNTTLPSTEFQQTVKTRVSEFRQFAQDGGLAIDTETDFQLGFGLYSNTLPSPELVAILDYELSAIDHLLRELTVSGAQELVSFERDPIPGEPGGDENAGSGVVQKYPVRLRFRITHGAFQQFINKISNDKDYFYIVRVLKVRNDNTVGPIKRTGAQEVFPRYINPETLQLAEPDLLGEWGYPDAPEAEVEAKAIENGFQPATEDAVVLMGQERLNVFMLVDITRFLNPDEIAKAKEEESKSSSSRRR